MPILLLSMIVVLVDQLSKYYIQSNMFPGLSWPIINNVFHITYVLNPGAAFGILEHQTMFFIVIAALMIGSVIYFYSHLPKDNCILKFGLGLMVGGAIGNVIDRIKTGYVVDFFDFRVWPVFNVADIAIVVGVGLIIYSILYLSNTEDESHEQQ